MVQIIQTCRLIGMPLLKPLIVAFLIFWHFSVAIVLANSGSYIAGQFAEKEGDFKNASFSANCPAIYEPELARTRVNEKCQSIIEATIKGLSIGIPINLHIWIIWTISPLRCFPRYIFAWIFNITCFAMHTIL